MLLSTKLRVTWQVEERPQCYGRQLRLHRSVGGRRRLNSFIKRSGKEDTAVTGIHCMLSGNAVLTF